MSMRFTTFFVLLGASLLLPTAKANNNLFLPGDAFFPTILTADRLQKLQADDATEGVFGYSTLGGYEMNFSGYAGYEWAKIPAVDGDFIANLSKAYGELRHDEQKRLVEIVKDGKTRLVETNGMRVLFYPKAFEFPRFNLGLRYNERWVEETVKFGHKDDEIRLCELVNDSDAIGRSWRDSTKVGSFEVVLPKVKLIPMAATEKPITLEGPVKAIVISSRPLKDYFNPSELGVGTIRIVDSTGIAHLQFEDGEWRIVAGP